MIRKLMFIAALMLLSGVAASAQSCPGSAPHCVIITWTPSADAAANPGLTYNVYRLNGACPATAPTSVPGGFTKNNTAAITTTTYTDATVSVGTYCYYATAFLNTTESIPSNDAQGMIVPKPPTSMGISFVAMVEVSVPASAPEASGG